jgi:hypothetical protein
LRRYSGDDTVAEGGGGAMEQSDYVSLLSRAIANLDSNTPEARANVYDRARRALRNQLATLEPKLSDAAVAGELQQLEGAIAQLEPAPQIQPRPVAQRQSAPQPPRTVTSRGVFCAQCVAETTDQTPGDVSTLNGIGRQFYGSAEPCPECASVVRTLWWTLVSLPVVPLASYRYKTAEELGTRARFWCRKLPARHWNQIFKTWVIGVAAVIAVFIGIYVYHQYK